MLWKFVCGADYESGGRYSERGGEWIGDKEAEKQFILDSYASLTPIQWLDFFGKKINNFWTQDSYQWFSKTMEETDQQENGFSRLFVSSVKFVDGMGYLFVFFFALIPMEKARKQGGTTRDFFIYLLFIHFFVYLVIEVQPRYAYLARILLFILATDGLQQGKKILQNEE